MPGSNLLRLAAIKNFRMSYRKKMILRLLCQGMAVAFLAGSCSPGIMAADAASNKDQKKERQALRRMQQQLNEVQQQKSALDQEKTVLEETLKKTHDETESHKRSAASAVAKASRLEKDIEAANSEKTELRTRLDEAAKRNEELSGQRKQLEQDLKNTTVALAKQDEQRKLCETNNDELYRIGRELADWYTSKGAMNAILEAEPFTRMKRVEMENLLENYRDKLEGQHLERKIN
jgi:chromosome segregation ATPase